MVSPLGCHSSLRGQGISHPPPPRPLGMTTNALRLACSPTIIDPAILSSSMSSVGKNIPHDSARRPRQRRVDLHRRHGAVARGADRRFRLVAGRARAHSRDRSRATRRAGVVASLHVSRSAPQPLRRDHPGRVAAGRGCRVVHRASDRRHRGGVARGRSARRRRRSSSTSKSWSRSSRSTRRSGAGCSSARR